MGLSSGQKTTKKYIGKAVGTLEDAQSDLLQNPLYLLGQQIATSFLQKPETYDETTKALIKGRAIDQAQGSYDTALRDLWEKAGSRGGYRSGFTRGQEAHLAQGMGQYRGDIERQVEEEAARARSGDTANALSIMTAALAPKHRSAENISNAYMGASANPIWQQPSLAQQGATGFGSFFSDILSGGANSAMAGGGGLASLFNKPT